jgi:hypothetical protein
MTAIQTMRPLYRELASMVQARLNCIERNNTEWQDKHEERILKLVSDHMPSGSGIDNGTKIDLDASTGEKLVFHFGAGHLRLLLCLCRQSEPEASKFVIKHSARAF